MGAICRDRLRRVVVLAALWAVAAVGSVGTGRADEYLGADPALPLTVEDAFVPDPRAVDVKLRHIYDHGRDGRDRFEPSAEAEVGIVPGLSASVGFSYRLGDAGDADSGEASFGAKWNFLAAGRRWPALAVTATVLAPYGYENDTTEADLALLASQPLGDGENPPYLHANLVWAHAFGEAAEARKDRYVAVLGFGFPVAADTVVLFDAVREQRAERGRYDNLIEVGMLHQFGNELLLAGGVGVGVGNSDTDLRIFFGLMRPF